MNTVAAEIRSTPASAKFSSSKLGRCPPLPPLSPMNGTPFCWTVSANRSRLRRWRREPWRSPAPLSSKPSTPSMVLMSPAFASLRLLPMRPCRLLPHPLHSMPWPHSSRLAKQCSNPALLRLWPHSLTTVGGRQASRSDSRLPHACCSCGRPMAQPTSSRTLRVTIPAAGRKRPQVS